MNWKEFFKPTKTKIIKLVALVILTYVSLMLSVELVIMYFAPPCPQPYSPITVPAKIAYATLALPKVLIEKIMPRVNLVDVGKETGHVSWLGLKFEPKSTTSQTLRKINKWLFGE